MCVGHHRAQTNTNKVNKIWSFKQLEVKTNQTPVLWENNKEHCSMSVLRRFLVHDSLRVLVCFILLYHYFSVQCWRPFCSFRLSAILFYVLLRFTFFDCPFVIFLKHLFISIYNVRQWVSVKRLFQQYCSNFVNVSFNWLHKYPPQAWYIGS